MSDWRVWVMLGLWMLWNAAMTLICWEVGYRVGLRNGRAGRY